MINAIPLPSTRAELAALSDQLVRQADAGRAIAHALTMRDAFKALARQARRGDERAFAETAAAYLDGLADGLELSRFGPPETFTLH